MNLIHVPTPTAVQQPVGPEALRVVHRVGVLAVAVAALGAAVAGRAAAAHLRAARALPGSGPGAGPDARHTAFRPQ